jgi:hypothetical protein
MESRTDAHAVGFGSAVPPSEFRSSKSADRLTPAHPERELVESDLAEAMPGSIPTPQKQLRPRKWGEVCLAQPPPPDTALKKGSKQTTKTDDIEAMKRAMAAYAGPVTRCAPGKARAKSLSRKKAADDATWWLQRHRHDVPVSKPVEDGEAEGERRRKARAERKRMRRAANTAARKSIGEQ